MLGRGFDSPHLHQCFWVDPSEFTGVDKDELLMYYSSMMNSTTTKNTPAAPSQAALALRTMSQKLATLTRRHAEVKAERDAIRSYLAEFMDPASDINNVSPEERAKRTRRVLNKTFN